MTFVNSEFLYQLVWYVKPFPFSETNQRTMKNGSHHNDDN